MCPIELRQETKANDSVMRYICNLQFVRRFIKVWKFFIFSFFFFHYYYYFFIIFFLIFQFLLKKEKKTNQKKGGKEREFVQTQDTEKTKPTNPTNKQTKRIIIIIIKESKEINKRTGYSSDHNLTGTVTFPTTLPSCHRSSKGLKI